MRQRHPVLRALRGGARRGDRQRPAGPAEDTHAGGCGHNSAIIRAPSFGIVSRGRVTPAQTNALMGPLNLYETLLKPVQLNTLASDPLVVSNGHCRVYGKQ